MFQLKSKGYVFLEALGIWARPDYSGIAYSDGDSAENRLADIIRDSTDISVLSPELRRQCKDWQTLYHLSSQRANVLRPFENLLKGKVLEIGAGCGAISRFLGETGGQILSLEGSPRRASIAASRTRDLPNVTVLAERFDEFNTDERFDAITLIGVLEYASMFSDHENPSQKMLERIRSLLKPDGHLFIAIENQLGLKYFAGAPEDHLGVPMYGIEGRYEKGQPQTFGHQALSQLIRRAGFSDVEFLAPFPDYKLPRSIVTENGCKSPDFDASAFAWQTVQDDPQLPRSTHFSLPHCWPTIFSNGLGMDLANSFIVIAGLSGKKAIPESLLAIHYSTARQAAFCKEARFERAADQTIHVNNRRLSQVEPGNQSAYELELIPQEPYWTGTLLSQEFVEIVSTPSWTISQGATYLRKYLGHLQSIIARRHLQPVDMGQFNSLLPGDLIDALPHNIVVDSEGIAQLFDTEWRTGNKLELGFLLCRSLFLLLNQANHLEALDADKNISRSSLALKLLEAAGCPVSSTDLFRYWQEEMAFQHHATGQPIAQLDSWRLDEPLIVIPASVATLYFASEQEDFNEARCQHHSLSLGRQLVQLNLKVDGVPVDRLRLDPSDRPGWLIVHELAVLDAQANDIWRYSKDSRQTTLVELETIVDEGPQALLYATGYDAQLILPPIAPQESLSILLDIEMLDEEQASQLVQRFSAVHVAQTAKLSSTERELFNCRGELEALQQHSTRMEQHQQALEEHTARLEQHQQTLQQHADALQGRLIEQESLSRALSGSIDEMLNSTSWRLTRPVRLTGRLARKGRSALRLARNLARQHGWRKVLERGLRVLRHEGLRGVINRARQHQRLLPPQQLPTAEEQRVAQAILGRDADGKYLLAATGGYCYIPPARPTDLEDRLRALNCKPYFSIVVPVYNTPLDLLDKLLQSVQAQWYPHWQLILADDKSPDESVQVALRNISDPKIRVLTLDKNQGISGATNVAIESADGDFIVFLDHDDELTEDCLYEMALCIEREQPDFIYSDEDKLAEDGSYTQPHFKPDWSPDTMMSTMYTCHASCVRKSLLARTGLLRSEFDGCQDWDFVLRVAEQTQRISHIPKVLYHWRIIPASVASDIAAKPYVLEASRQVRLDALRRRGLKGDVEPVSEVKGYFRVNYFPQNEPLISIIIPSRDNAEVLRRCIDSIRSQSTYRRYEIILLDNGSLAPDTVAYFKLQDLIEGTCVIRHDAPFNFSELNNLGVQQAKGDILLFLNDDTEVLCPDWLERLAGYAQLPHIAAVGAKLLYPGKAGIQHAGVLNLANGPVHALLRHVSDAPAYFMRNLLEYNWMAVTGACLMIERSKFEAIGGFDESFPIAYNDIELCFRALDHGYYNVVCQAVTLTHHESVSRGLDHVDPAKLARLQNELARLYQKHPQYYQHDPFHNPNLHPCGLNFEVPV
ncbi:glycosyltransferase [Pseudomonas nitroreducens]|uniref:glycosyltransferase n=1 Tax=Pseudomonas nitroreducens TaxID=46680 RepID=UPI001FB715D6|nr:glycosyltransferase [Pseudomonas nitroreducens]MCJ1880852.1 glycosyltransferase [Pseudomonas nitroreducens]MCJ1895630.1 glycosyltransferase [Pseudomonas nitroreducens]